MLCDICICLPASIRIIPLVLPTVVFDTYASMQWIHLTTDVSMAAYIYKEPSEVDQFCQICKVHKQPASSVVSVYSHTRKIQWIFCQESAYMHTCWWATEIIGVSVCTCKQQVWILKALVYHGNVHCKLHQGGILLNPGDLNEVDILVLNISLPIRLQSNLLV